jgi:hypothetical protein
MDFTLIQLDEARKIPEVGVILLAGALGLLSIEVGICGLLKILSISVSTIEEPIDFTLRQLDVTLRWDLCKMGA